MLGYEAMNILAGIAEELFICNYITGHSWQILHDRI